MRLVLLAGLFWVGAVSASESGQASDGSRSNETGTDADIHLAEISAMQVMDDFMQAFNRRDMEAWATTLNFPHVRIAGGAVKVYRDRRSFIEGRNLNDFAATTGWHHSAWDERRIVQSSPRKVHIAVEFSRYREDGKRYATFQSLYIVEKINDRWGITARSSFAP